MPREDLSVCKDEFEMVGIEILSSKSKNILCCCVYRHPNTDAQEFVNYLDNLLQKPGKQNKHIFLMGDFNLNLLNYEIHSDTNDFINTLVSQFSPLCFAPKLLLLITYSLILQILIQKVEISAVILVTTFHKF